MSNFFSKKLKTVLVLTILLCFTGLFTLSAQTVCDNGTDSQGGYVYEYWKDNGTGCMVLGSGGTFSIDWSNINNLLARKGLRPGSKNLKVNYAADYQPNGNSYLCVYGWTRNPLIEYYIVDSWGTWRPPGGQGFVGTVTSDGGTYDIYKTQRVDQPSIDGNATFYQYWSVRQSKRTSGTITVANHFNAWTQNGMNMGNLYEVSFCVEGYQSSGKANVYSMTMTEGSVDPTPTPQVTPAVSGNIVIRAAGSVGGEIIEAEVNGTVVDSWTLQAGFQTLVTNGTGGIRIHFTNDDEVSDGRDVQIDYIEYNGEVFQAEDQEINTGAWENDSCGGSYSEWLYCSGYIQFNTGGHETPGPVITPTPVIIDDTGMVTFGKASYTASSNSSMDAEVYINTGSYDVSAYGIVVDYSTSILSVNTNKGTQGVSAGSDGFVSAARVEGGSINIGGFDAYGKNADTNFHLITIHFNTLNEGTGSLTLTANELVDPNYITIGVPRGDTAAVRVGPGGGLLGDVDGSGTVNIVDALMVAQDYVGLNPSPYNPDLADVDCDGTISIVDALRIAQYYVNLLPSLSCN